MFKIALTPLLAPPQTRMYPLRCPSGPGRRGGAGAAGLAPAVRGESGGGVGDARTGGAGPWVTHCGCPGRRPPGPLPRPEPTVGGGGVRPLRPPPPPCVEGTGFILGSYWSHLLPADYMSPSARALDTKSLAPGRVFLSESARRLVTVPGRDGRASRHPGKTGVWRLFLRKGLAPSRCLHPRSQQCHPARVFHLRHNYK